MALLKKGDWHERGLVTDQCYDRSGKPDKMSDKKLGQKSSQRRSSDARQLGCVFQDMTPPKALLRKCTDMRKPIQRVKFTKALAHHTEIRDSSEKFAQVNIMSVAPTLRNLRIGLRRRQRARCPRSSVEAGQKCVEIKGACRSNILLTFGKSVPACINS